MTPWYKNVTLRREVREGRSFSPDEFAIALEQVLAGTAPEDYRDPEQFFSRTCFTRALNDHAGMVLRRLAGRTENAAPVVALVTQFGGGKTHTLTALYHLAKGGPQAVRLPGVAGLQDNAGVDNLPSARVGAFVGNAWDPTPGAETPWIDLAQQLAGERGVEALGTAARETPPGTDALGRVFAAADAPVLLLFNEVLNFVNRHRAMADGFYAFIQNVEPAVAPRSTRFRLTGDVPPEVWNRIGTRLLPKLRLGEDLDVRLDISVRFDAQRADSLAEALEQSLADLGLENRVRIERD